MSSPSNSCGQQVDRLNQQVSVMRKEIKNIRQHLDSGVRAHRKQMTALQSAMSNIRQEKTVKCSPSPPKIGRTAAALEQGNILTMPIGYISSCFSVKNATPRQPMVCDPSRAILRVLPSVFNNPEHSLVGLEQYSHVWVIFLFHKNGHMNLKAKVKPPRLNGQKVGVYSTRSPHRPNALGLSLAKLERIVGDTIHLSEIDMIDGTPVLDVKPFIPEYDSPQTRADREVKLSDHGSDHFEVTAASLGDTSNPLENLKAPPCRMDTQCDSEDEGMGTHSDPRILLSEDKIEVQIQSSTVSATAQTTATHLHSSLGQDLHKVLEGVKTYLTQGSESSESSSEGPSQTFADSKESQQGKIPGNRPCYGEEAYSTIASWIREPCVSTLEVRFTSHAERELREFLPPHATDPGGGDGRPRFHFLKNSDEAVNAIRSILSADPRSVYRRTCCQDRLFFFTLDTADITCWFGQDFAEVLRIRPVKK